MLMVRHFFSIETIIFGPNLQIEPDPVPPKPATNLLGFAVLGVGT